MNRLVGVGLAAALLTLFSCGTEPEAIAPIVLPEPPAVTQHAVQPVIAVSSAIEGLAVTALDIDTVNVAATVTVVNQGNVDVVLEELAWSATADEGKLTGVIDAGARCISPGGTASVRLDFAFDVAPGTNPWITMELESTSACQSAGGASAPTVAHDTVTFPRIMPPSLEITAIRILKDELINTRLGVDLAVHNPNAFDLEFATLGYRLYGEGRYWASGKLASAFRVPAGGTAQAALSLTMNFTDMDRSLLDRVIKLARVNYRLSGAGFVDTGLDFLPRFELPFDLSGSVNVR